MKETQQIRCKLCWLEDDDPADPFEMVNGPFSGDIRENFRWEYLLKNTPD